MKTLTLLAALTLAPCAPAADISGGYGPPPAKAKKSEYTNCLEYVEQVGDCLLVVGLPKDFTPKAYYTSFRVESLKWADGTEVEKGVYLCTIWEGEDQNRKKLDKPVWRRQKQYEPATTAGEVQSLTPFRPEIAPNGVSPRPTLTVAKTGSAVADHMCPTCGAGPWYSILGFNGDGTHNHLCPNCGTVFTH